MTQQSKKIKIGFSWNFFSLQIFLFLAIGIIYFIISHFKKIELPLFSWIILVVFFSLALVITFKTLFRFRKFVLGISFWLDVENEKIIIRSVGSKDPEKILQSIPMTDLIVQTIWFGYTIKFKENHLLSFNIWKKNPVFEAFQRVIETSDIEVTKYRQYITEKTSEKSRNPTLILIILLTLAFFLVNFFIISFSAYSMSKINSERITFETFSGELKNVSEQKRLYLQVLLKDNFENFLIPRDLHYRNKFFSHRDFKQCLSDHCNVIIETAKIDYFSIRNKPNGNNLYIYSIKTDNNFVLTKKDALQKVADTRKDAKFLAFIFLGSGLALLAFLLYIIFSLPWKKYFQRRS